MSLGSVEAIYIAPNRGEPTIYIEQAHLVPGRGIEGDRYYNFSNIGDIQSNTGHEITLIEIEAIEAICAQDVIILSPDKTRRNIITRGISLNDLIGLEFMINDVRLLGIRLCEPCDYLASQTDPLILVSMSHRGGLRAAILTDGIIKVNDMIVLPLKEKHD